MLPIYKYKVTRRADNIVLGYDYSYAYMQEWILVIGIYNTKLKTFVFPLLL